MYIMYTLIQLSAHDNHKKIANKKEPRSLRAAGLFLYFDCIGLVAFSLKLLCELLGVFLI